LIETGKMNNNAGEFTPHPGYGYALYFGLFNDCMKNARLFTVARAGVNW